MGKELDDLISLCKWGQEWIDHLRSKPHSGHIGRDLNKYFDAFAHIAQKAASFQKEHASRQEISRLAARASEIKHHFQHFLRLVEERPPESPVSSPSYLPVKAERKAVLALRPVPIGEHKLPPLPYPYDALEPYIDEETMRLHHDKHHQSYVDGLNKAEKMMAQARANNDFDLIKHWEREAAFHGAGHYLHTLFWTILSPDGGGEPEGELAEQINRDFGSFDAFKRHFSQAAEKVEGGGWAILVWSPRAQHLEILTAEKHQNLSQWDVIPLLVLDVWEHAYYLTYKNERKKYIDACWTVFNWPEVRERYLQARMVRWQPT